MYKFPSCAVGGYIKLIQVILPKNVSVASAPENKADRNPSASEMNYVGISPVMHSLFVSLYITQHTHWFER
jgi:hypothetical protein